MYPSNNDKTPIEEHYATFLVVGGGIAGVSCAETIALYHPEASIILLTESNVIKTIANLEPIARYVYKFDVKERSLDDKNSEQLGLAAKIVIIIDQLAHIECLEHRAITKNERKISYKSICLCTGAAPQLIRKDNPRVIGIRDTDSVLNLQQRLKDATSIMLLGNGGIASELAYELRGVEVHWVVKDGHIASTFVDPGAAYFFQESWKSSSDTSMASESILKRLRYDERLTTDIFKEEIKHGAALGPDWHRKFALQGNAATSANSPVMHFKTSVQDIIEETNCLIVILANGEQIKCDFLVSATGVEPRHNFSTSLPLTMASDGGIAVNEMMETNVNDIYAAGDVCTSNWEPGDNWFQMRLWTQARQMGSMAGRAMAAKQANEVIYQDFCFELFGHVTQLFGHSVVLLGRYNGQGLGTNYEILIRTTPKKEYIKFVIANGRLRGAVLIGNTELAETCENLILNCIDITPYGDDILNPDIDIDDYFD